MLKVVERILTMNIRTDQSRGSIVKLGIGIHGSTCAQTIQSYPPECPKSANRVSSMENRTLPNQDRPQWKLGTTPMQNRTPQVGVPKTQIVTPPPPRGGPKNEIETPPFFSSSLRWVPTYSKRFLINHELRHLHGKHEQNGNQLIANIRTDS